MPEQGPDWFLVATEACGGGTPDLGYVLEVWGYIRGVGVGNKSGGCQGVHEIGGRAPTLMGASGLPWSISDAPWASSAPKMIFVNFLRLVSFSAMALGSRLIG